MKYEQAIFIEEKEYWISERNGKTGIVSDHVVMLENHDYYCITGREKRYTLRTPTGIINGVIYENAIQDECFFISGMIRATRKYRQEIDSAYFKFYDDAEEVLNNIITFCTWMRNLPKLKRPMMKKILYQNGWLLRDVPVTEDWERQKASMLGRNVKKRNDLAGLKKYHQNALDLKGDD